MATKAKKILLVEPDLQLVELARYPLEEEGYTVLAAKDGKEGLTRARREQPDLVLVDYKLPTMKGNEFAKTLRKDVTTEHQRIIMIADESQLENLEIGPGSSVDDFLIKPFGPAELITKIKPLMVSEDDKLTKLISTGNADLDNKMGGGVVSSVKKPPGAESQDNVAPELQPLGKGRVQELEVGVLNVPVMARRRARHESRAHI